MRRTRPLLAWLTLALCSCAGSSGGAWRASAPTDPGPVRAGMAMDAALASMHAAPPETRVSVVELRALGLDREPWPRFDLDEAVAATGRVGMVGRRTCQRWDGLRRTETDRASWYVFEAGRLTAFDHYEFDGSCAATNTFVPSPPEGVDDERTLVRFMAQRYPLARGDISERLEKGMSFVAVGRLEDAEAELSAGTRVLGDIDIERKMKAGAETPELDAREAELRPLHTRLRAAIRDARRAEREARRAEREARRRERERLRQEAVSSGP